MSDPAAQRGGEAGKTLVIVESPAKARTIQRYLGADYVVVASKGHVRDLPKSGLQVDTDGGYTPRYEVPTEQEAIVSELKSVARGCDSVLLATDPDREGEAIAWHLAHELRELGKPTARVEFFEITRTGVQRGIERPRALDRARFEAQQARRILDRLIGYELSPLLWRRLARRVNGHFLSAGRVQSAALRLIVEREDEIAAFTPEERWAVSARMRAATGPAFAASLAASGGPEAEAIGADLRSAAFSVASVERAERRRRAPPPLVTASLQRDASARFGFSAARTMQIAQRLFEGVDVGDEGPVGLITYARTDSTRLSAEATEAAREHIAKRFGERYLSTRPNTSPNQGATQGAHEAIRPTSQERSPDALRGALKADERKIYGLIWERFLACQMADAVYEDTSVTIAAQGEHRYALRASARALRSQGWLRAMDSPEGGDATDEDDPGGQLPTLKEGEALRLVAPPGATSERRVTRPSARYTEGTLVAGLEQRGIGRPSTYAEVVSKVLSRDYALKRAQEISPTRLGSAKIAGLKASLPEVLDYELTARIEQGLDEVEAGRASWVALVDRFYRPFKRAVDAELAAQAPGAGWPREQPSERVCDECGSPMLRRWGPRSDYHACSGYPKCRHTVDTLPPEAPRVLRGRACPSCGRDLLIRSGRADGDFYLACSGRQRGATGCAHTERLPAERLCPECDAELARVSGASGLALRCERASCGYTRPLGDAEEPR